MPLLPWRRGKGGKTPFHITDLENFTADLEHGNNMSAFKHAVRILNGALNGPLPGIRGVQTEWDMDEAVASKMDQLGERLQKYVDANELRLGEASAKRLAVAEAESKAETKAKTAAVKHDAKHDVKHAKGAARIKAKDKDGKDIEEEDTELEDTEKDLKTAAAQADTDVLTTSGEPFVGAVPWALIAQLAMMIIKMISDWKQQQT